MAIVNVTPDSFSDGGLLGPASALAACEKLIRDGADILDIGGESSRPGAPSVTVEDEWARISEVLASAITLGVPVSVDTCKTEIMRRALDLGVDIINDIRALEAPGAAALMADHGSCGVCLMHMKGDPKDMQLAPTYPDVVREVQGYLRHRLSVMSGLGVDLSRLVLDPGIGFGKSPEHNMQLLARQSELLELGQPLLIGWSRKSTLGHITGRAIDGRLVASVAAALAGITHGARIVRVHDVAETADAMKVWAAAGLIN
ncbi:MAG: dihydropteroate synthase [Aquabacterium sp.]|nr:dihydropteroate synthase [Aquabacterium sp.]